MQHTISIGERLRTARKERGFSQRELADRAGISTDMISRIERDDRGLSLPTMYKLADALGMDPSRLLGKRERLEKGGQNRGVLGVRDAILTSWDIPGLDLGDDGPPATLDELRRAVDTGWELYWTGHLGLLASLLPPLLSSGRATEREMGAPAAGLLAQAYQLAADLMVHCGQDVLAFAGAARAIRAASRGDDPLQEATLAGTLSWALLHQGRLDQAEEVAALAAAKAEPRGQVPIKHLTVYGALLLSAAAPAAAAGNADAVASYMTEAKIAGMRFTEGDRHDYEVSFGPSQLAMQAVHQQAALREPARALAAARVVNRADLRTISWGALHMDVAQANLDLGRTPAAVEALLTAHGTSSEWARHQGPWRALAVSAVRAGRRRDTRTELLAKAAGIG